MPLAVKQDMSRSTSGRSSTQIRRITLFRVAVPLKKEIKHASHSRTESENLVVRVELKAARWDTARACRGRTSRAKPSNLPSQALGSHDWSKTLGCPGRLRRGRAHPGISGLARDPCRPARHGRQRGSLCTWNWPSWTPTARLSANRWGVPSRSLRFPASAGTRHRRTFATARPSRPRPGSTSFAPPSSIGFIIFMM